MTEQNQQTDFSLYPQARTSIDQLTGRVDVYPIEQHTYELSTTEYPVESGSVLTDQAVARRAKIRLDGHVSDVMAAPGNAFGRDRAADTWGAIERLFRKRITVTVTTDYRVYRDMLIVRAVARRDKSTGRALSFVIDLAEVLFTDTDIVRFDRESVVGPAVDRTDLVDRGDVVAPVVPVPSSSMPAARRMAIASKDIIVPPYAPQIEIQGLIEDPTVASQNPAVEAIRPLVPTRPSQFEKVVRAQRIPLTRTGRQTFRTILGGQSVRLSTFYQPLSQSWYASLAGLDQRPIVSSMRLGEGSSPMQGRVLSGFVGELVVAGTGDPEREAWQENNDLIYLVSESRL